LDFIKAAQPRLKNAVDEWGLLLIVRPVIENDRGGAGSVDGYDLHIRLQVDEGRSPWCHNLAATLSDIKKLASLSVSI
jgi:hypothetical protein